MKNKAYYQYVTQYEVSAECVEPLHVGSADGVGAEVLVHPVDDIPFIQATGIAGAFRDYFSREYGTDIAEAWFGGQEKDSCIRFSDGVFESQGLSLELRPRVAIDRVTGSSDSRQNSGTDIISGQKFNMECVSAGARFVFHMYVYGSEATGLDLLDRCLKDLHEGKIQLGGQKSNGCGYVTVLSARKRTYDMHEQDDRTDWMKEAALSGDSKAQVLDLAQEQGIGQRIAYRLNITAETVGELLVKSIGVTDYSDSAPDAENMRNGKGDYIVPGSSVKGAMRARMEMIIGYMEADPDLIVHLFGKSNSAGKSDGCLGIIHFRDVVVGNAADNFKAEKQTRIKIDKFTGGVMNGALFSEKGVHGSMSMTIDIMKSEYSREACALTILALRDMAKGYIQLGGGYSIGKGYVHLKRLEIQAEEKTAEIDFEENKILDQKHVITECLNSLRKEG